MSSERPDVSNATVQTRFRSTPEEAEQAEANTQRTHANILFVGESNTSRSVLAEAIFRSLVAEAGMSKSLQCESKVTPHGTSAHILSGLHKVTHLGSLRKRTATICHMQAHNFKHHTAAMHAVMETQGIICHRSAMLADLGLAGHPRLQHR